MKVHDSKRKNLSLFQSNYIQLQSVVSSITPRKYIVQEVPSKKKKPARGGKEEKKKKGMERVCAKGKEKERMRCGRKEERKEERMKEKEKEKKGEEEKEEERIEKAAQEMHCPLRTHSLARS